MPRLVRALWAETFNPYGGGLVHLEIFETTGAIALPYEIRRKLRRLRMNTRQLGRLAQGILLNPTVAVDGSDWDWKDVDGLDVTLENDQEQWFVDFVVVASFSVNPGVVRFAPKIDGVIDPTQALEVTSTATAATFFAGHFLLTLGPGSHRIQLAITADNAATITLTAKQRRLRVAGLIGT